MNYELNLDGYAVVKNAIPMDCLTGLWLYARDLLNIHSGSNRVDILKAMEELEAADKKAFYRFCKELPETLPGKKIAALPKLLMIATWEIEGPVYNADCSVFFNKKGVDRLQCDWHSEADYFVNGNAITLWFPWLHEVNEENGTMIMTRGSHLKELHETREAVPNGLTQMRIPESDLTEFEKVPMNLRLGDAVLFLRKTVHRTGENKSGHPRTSIVVRYTDKTGKFNDGWQRERH